LNTPAETHSTLHPDDRANTFTANDGQVTWPLLALSAIALMLSVFNMAHRLARDEQLFLAGLILVLGTLFTAMALMWNKLATLKAEHHQLLLQSQAPVEHMTIAESRHMMAHIGHEIRTPLNGVIGMLGLLLETELSAEQKNYAAIAHGSGRTLLSILDEMLDRAKSEEGHATAPPHVELAAVIENVTELLAPRAHAKSIEISSFIAPDVPEQLPFRDLHMRQILFNLAGNAIKFTAHGGISIRAIVRDGQLNIAIRDTGIGMSSQEQACVFKAFAQANEETSKRYGGTGLGLTISKTLVEAMGGSLVVESIVGTGSTFTITLPLADTTHDSENLRLSGRHYAIVMDDTMMRYDLQKNLEAQGATTLVYEATEQNCVEVLASTATAVIVDATAAAVLHQLARNRAKRHKSLPQIWLTVNPEERRSLRAFLTKPTTGYLMKPIRRSTLVRQLTERDDAHVAVQTAKLRQLAQVARKTKKLRVLLVEDSAVNALLVKTILTKAGHDSRLVTSGQAALDMLAADRNFDVVLMDVEMPEMDGYATTRAIRSAEVEWNLPALRILALTANTGRDAIARCLAAGMTGHLAKPFERADLEEALATVTQAKAA
jgi:signal transduction histidine kinase/CheY-like chemotaxis protein